MSSKGVSIMIQQEPDGWHVIASIDGAVAQKSPPLPDHDAATKAAEIVRQRFEAKFSRRDHWRRER